MKDLIIILTLAALFLIFMGVLFEYGGSVLAGIVLFAISSILADIQSRKDE